MTKIITKIEKGLNRHWKNFLDRNYLGSHNLEDGEDMVLTIADFKGEEEVVSSDGTKKVKPVLYFKEDVPKMILNITNATTIENLYGSHPADWIGKKIQIYVKKIRAFGEDVNALRIRDIVPKYDVDVTKYKNELNGAATLAQLKSIWTKFPASVRNNAEVAAFKDKCKAKLSDR